jgi:Heparinase II/III-like protein.
MRVVPINEAEAIIEPFWDGGSSEHPKDKYSLLKEYTVDIAAGVIGAVKQEWYCVEVSIDSAPSGCSGISIKRACDMNIIGYDVFRVFGALPDSVKMTVNACIDGENVIIIDNYTGINNSDEIDGVISGKKITSIELSFCTTGNKPCSIILMWLGLSNRIAQKEMEERKSPYTSEWTGHMAENPGNAAPEIGIYFDTCELDLIRSRVKQGSLKKVFDRVREEAVQDMDIIPEDCIGTFVPDPNEYCRRRDMKKKALAEPMERLAFVGLIDENLEMSHMAVRMALSVSHCINWCESILGAFPGATWHHRSFTEEIYTRACAVVLDWAGYCMTPHGKQVVTDAMIMKGLPRIESDFKRIEYIRRMNQGIAFCTGRIIGLIALVQSYPRYKGLLKEAEGDLHEMLDNYIYGDGGTMEGVSYWDYTFGNAVRALYALSRYHKIPFREYLPDKFIKTGDYALCMHSTTADGTTFLPVVDAHISGKIKTSLAAAFFSITGKDEWKRLYNKITDSNKPDGDIYQIVFYSDELGNDEIHAQYEDNTGIFVMKDVGYVRIVRSTENIGNILFFYCSGPVEPGHFHEDKGSFIIEAAGEVLAMDRGITNYANPETKFLKKAEYHNLLYPKGRDGRTFRQPADMPGGRIGSVEYDRGLLLIASTQHDAWEKDLFDVNIRRIISPLPDLYILDDEIEMNEAIEMSFIINSVFPLMTEANDSYITASKTKLRIIPLNWRPDKVLTGVDGIDWALNPVNRLRLRSEARKSHRLLTAVEVLNVSAVATTEFRFTSNEGISIRKGNMEITVNAGLRQMSVVKIYDRSLKTLEAVCNGTDWRILNSSS